MDTFEASTKISLGDHGAKYVSCFELCVPPPGSGADQGQCVSPAFRSGFECVYGWSREHDHLARPMARTNGSIKLPLVVN